MRLWNKGKAHRYQTATGARAQPACGLGVSTSTITSWERNHARPALWQIPRIIVFLRNSPLPQASIAEQLVMFRKHLGISQKRLARALGIDPGTLARWEAGSNTPNPAVMVYLEKLSADDL